MPEHLYGTPITTKRDNLFSDIGPAPKVEIKIIAALGTSSVSVTTTYERGTVLAQDEDSGKLYIAGTTAVSDQTLTPDCILCDRETFTADTPISVYVTGRFNQYALIWSDGYIPTLADKNALRDKNILLAADFD
jgi:hypothetical protein